MPGTLEEGFEKCMQDAYDQWGEATTSRERAAARHQVAQYLRALWSARELHEQGSAVSPLLDAFYGDDALAVAQAVDQLLQMVKRN
jgi:hypothetical protein